MEVGQIYTLKESIDYSADSTVSKIVSKNKNGSTTLFSFDNGQQLSEHTAPFDAIAIIIDGKCEIRISGESNILYEGQMIIMPANVPHALEALEALKMLLIMVKA